MRNMVLAIWEQAITHGEKAQEYIIRKYKKGSNFILPFNYD